MSFVGRVLVVVSLARSCQAYLGFCSTQWAEYGNGGYAPCYGCNSDGDCPDGRACWASVYCHDSVVCTVDGECDGVPNAGSTQTQTPTPTPTSAGPVSPSASPIVIPPNLGSLHVGYFENWAQYRAEPYKFEPEDIDATLFTHIIYAFAKLSTSFAVEPYEWNDVLAGGNGMYARFHTRVRQQNPNIKTLIAIGGWTFNTDSSTRTIFSNMVSTSSNRATCIQSILNYCATHGFDGVDLDWEYPGDTSRGGSANDKTNFGVFMTELRAAAPAGFLISIAVAGGVSTSSSAYDRAPIYAAVDWVGLMTYDLQESGKLSPHSALRNAVYNADQIVQWWRATTPAAKLVLGLPSYAHTFKMSGGASPVYGQNSIGSGTAGTYTQQAGFLAYYEVMANMGSTVTADSATSTAYAWSGNQFASFDHTSTVGSKIQYVMDNGMAGVMTWAIGLDDFTTSFPFSRAVAAELVARQPSGTTASASPSRPASPSRTPTISVSPSRPASVSATRTPTISVSPSRPASVSATRTPTISVSPSRPASVSASPTRPASASASPIQPAPPGSSPFESCSGTTLPLRAFRNFNTELPICFN